MNDNETVDLDPFGNPGWFSFAGRINRTTYFIRGILLGLPLVAVTLILESLRSHSNAEAVFSLVVLLLVPITMVVSAANAAKRAHDCGLSGWTLLLLFVPLVGSFFGLYLLFAAGEPDSNAYGHPQLA